MQRSYFELSPLELIHVDRDIYRDYFPQINVKNICFQQLAISKKQAIGSPVKEDLAALSKLMADSALTPNKEDKSQASDGGIGVWIQKIEDWHWHQQ
jgi:hypothetical protein